MFANIIPILIFLDPPLTKKKKTFKNVFSMTKLQPFYENILRKMKKKKFDRKHEKISIKYTIIQPGINPNKHILTSLRKNSLSSFD